MVSTAVPSTFTVGVCGGLYQSGGLWGSILSCTAAYGSCPHQSIPRAPIAYDPFIRFDGRQQEEQPEMLGGSRPGYQYDPPTEGADLIGYKIRATFPTAHGPAA